MNITRHHLIGFGATQYLAKKLTHSLSVQGKSQRSNLYKASDVLRTASAYHSKSRIHHATKTSLSRLIQQLKAVSENVVRVPFGAPETDASPFIKQLLKPRKTNIYKLESAALKGKQANGL
ncbi:MAG: hypothetical protein ACFCU8_08380 [Thermosynechococcaceae cyanobacterium]